MATTAQLRAALAVLSADIDAAAKEADIPGMSGTDPEGVEHALLAGLLYRMMGVDLQQSLIAAPDQTAREERARAAAPGKPVTDPVQRREQCEQAHFEAFRLADRIIGLHFSTAPPVAALQAAAHTAEASRALLRIHRDSMDSAPRHRAAAQSSATADWQAVIEQLERAIASARTARAAAESAAHPARPGDSAD